MLTGQVWFTRRELTGLTDSGLSIVAVISQFASQGKFPSSQTELSPFMVACTQCAQRKKTAIPAPPHRKAAHLHIPANRWYSNYLPPPCECADSAGGNPLTTPTAQAPLPHTAICIRGCCQYYGTTKAKKALVSVRYPINSSGVRGQSVSLACRQISICRAAMASQTLILFVVFHIMAQPRHLIAETADLRPTRPI